MICHTTHVTLPKSHTTGRALTVTWVRGDVIVPLLGPGGVAVVVAKERGAPGNQKQKKNKMWRTFHTVFETCLYPAPAVAG